MTLAREADLTGHDPLEGVDAEGIITTGARRANLSAEFFPVLEEATERVARLDGTPALYVYGSVATGQARLGSSDVDLLTIGLDGATARHLGSSLTAAFPGLSRGVEVGAAQPSDHDGLGDEAYGNRVFLRHYCVHLTGPDLRRELPDCPADRAAARGFNGDIELHAQRWRRELGDNGDPAAIARRMARKTLLAVAGLVSIHDSTWTTDRLAAARRFAEIHPRLSTRLATLVDWGSAQPLRPSRPEVQGALDSVVASVVDDFAKHIGLWSSGRPSPIG